MAVTGQLYFSADRVSKLKITVLNILRYMLNKITGSSEGSTVKHYKVSRNDDFLVHPVGIFPDAWYKYDCV
jgi:hypothetical protein